MVYSSIVSDNNDTQFNRRNVLKATGATVSSAIAATKLPENVSASKTAGDDIVKKALDSTRVSGIVSELGGFELRRADSVEISITSEKLTRPIFRQAIFFVGKGALVFTEAHSGRTDAKYHFEFNQNDVPDQFESHVRGGSDGPDVTWTVEEDGWSRDTRSPRSGVNLPRTYTELPHGTEPMLIGTEEGSAHFRRLATDDERELLAPVKGVSVTQQSTVVVGSDIGGFAVVNHKEDYVSEVEVTPDAGTFSPNHGVTSTRSLTTQFDSTELSTSPSIQDHEDEWYNHPCFGPCTGCGGAGFSCIICSPACASSPTGVGLVACAACLFGVCHGVLVATCAACADCFSDHPP